jgi:hypothetical protein
VAKDLAMKAKSKVIARFLIILVIVIVFACGLNIWAQNSPRADDFRWIHNRDTENELVGAFATALRINHPDAYDMIDPSLKPRLDEWMRKHQSRKCIYQAVWFSIWPGTNDGYKITFHCIDENEIPFTFRVDDMIVEDMKVIDWGEVVEVEE